MAIQRWGGGAMPAGIARDIREQIDLIGADFRQTYYQLISGSVQLHWGVDDWTSTHPEYREFVSHSMVDQRRIVSLERSMRRTFVHELAGQTQGVGQVLALRMAQGHGVNPNRVAEDVDIAVQKILGGRYVDFLSGVRKLGYWSGFARAINY